MDAEKLKEEQLKLEKKLSKEPGDFVKDLRAMQERNDVVGLEFKLKELAKHNQAILSQKASDEELNQAKRRVKVLSAPYNEQVRGNTAKSRYIGLLLQELDYFEGESSEED